MFKGLMIDFLPWILYAIIAGPSPMQHDLAIMLAFAVSIAFDRQHLKQGFILSWGTVLFFGFMLFATIVFKNQWLINHAFLLSNLSLTAIVAFSILIKKPFTIQYAKQQVPAVYWKAPLFIRINMILSAVWGLSFLLGTVAYVFPMSDLLQQMLSFVPVIFAIWFSKWFPNWYKSKKMRRAKPIESSGPNFDLAENYAPVLDELDVENLTVIGEIPKDLNGVYMRNGPNPQFEPISYTYPFDGDGMIHAVYINEGKAHYRNRFVETKGLMKERKAEKALYGGIMHAMPIDPKWAGPEDEPIAIKNGAFIHIVRHAEQYLAMWEGGPAYQMTADLKTLGEWVPRGSKSPINVCAHTRYDSITGELWLINYDVLSPPYLSIYKLDKQGSLVQKWDIDKAHGTMIHDFVLTQNHVIVFDCPIVFDVQGLMSGAGIGFNWKPELGARIGIMPRSGGKMKWYDTEAFFVFHFANAYEFNNEIIIDFVRHEKLSLSAEGSSSAGLPMLYRTTINLNAGMVKNTALDDRLVEFPRIREDMDSLQHQYIYTPTKTTDIKKRRLLNALIKYDLSNQSSQVHDFGQYAEIGEAVFVPKQNSQSEDDGYLMLFVYDSQTQQSEFVILDAQNMNAEPLARIKMPRRIPHGLHGSWMPAPL
jgi:carotenoid cleavage dioxygenase